MKNKISVFLFACLSAVLLVSCDDPTSSVGVELQPTQDEIFVGSEVFNLSTETFAVDKIVSKPDSFLLGTYIDDAFGTTQADVLSQVLVAKKGYTFMDENLAVTTPDSVVVRLGFNSFFGVNSSPMKIDVYELDNELVKNKIYMSDLDVEDYVDLSKPIGSTIATVINSKTGKNNKSVSVKLDADFLNRFFTTDSNVYVSQENFLKHFKGLYVTASNFGSSTMLNVSQLTMTLYFHYKYVGTGDVVQTYLDFPVNSEIASVNCIRHPTRVLAPKSNDSYNYLVSPANYYTKIRIPLQNIAQKTKIEGKTLAVNGASIKINILDKDSLSAESYIPYAKNLLLVREDKMQTFFEENRLPNDSTAFLASVSFEKNTDNTLNYYYAFNDLAQMIERELKKQTVVADGLDFVLVPVTTKYISRGGGYYSSPTSVLSEVKQSLQMRASSIFSGSHSENPMVLEVVYSGF